MAAKSKIEWTDCTWTPIRARVWNIQSDGSGKEGIGWHCEHVSEGCRNCYAEGINRRLGTLRDFKPGELYREANRGYKNGEVKSFLDERMLAQPLRWKKPRMIFVCSMTDLFGDWIPDEWIDKVFAVMALCPQHTFQVLTKRPKRMREYMERDPRDAINSHAGTLMHWDDMPDRDDWPMKNVWLGTSAEDQETANQRIPDVLATPAAIRFVSAEPLLGPIDFQRISMGTSDATFYDQPEIKTVEFTINSLTGVESFRWNGLDQIITGGESGPGARPMHPDWVRDIRDQCTDAGTAFLFKQWGEWIEVDGPQCRGIDQNWHASDHWFKPDGQMIPVESQMGKFQSSYSTSIVRRVGKKRAGRVLDGIEHNGFPEVSA